MDRSALLRAPLAAASLVAVPALAAPLLGPAPSGVLALAGLLRVLWLEENIHHDLAGRSRMPAGYRPPAGGRGANRLATAMRAEALAWWAALLAVAAVWLGQGLPPLLGAPAAVALTLLALRRAEAALSVRAVARSGGRLPVEALTAPASLARAAVRRLPPDGRR